MAGSNLSPRQRMINLMYLVFIAMLALNMSKEVLQAFGLMNERTEEANIAASERNNLFMEGLAEKVDEQPLKYKPLKAKADSIKVLSDNFTSYLKGLKEGALTGVEKNELGELPAEKMDKGDHFDEMFFLGDGYKAEGKEFLNQINTFRDGVAVALGDGFPEVKEDLMKKFATPDRKIKNGGTQPWLEANYQGFPLIASVAKLTQMEADVKTTESEVLQNLLAGQLKSEVSLTNFEAIVVPEKTAFFSGENFKGKIVLGKKDKTLKAHKVVVNGRALPESSMKEGQTILSFPAGNVGEKKISGEFQFKEGDSIIKIPIKSSYAVISKPNSATISADKMNVVYRGVSNPMTITFAGIPDNKVNASGSGLSKGSGAGKYVMRPGSGREVKINVSGKLPDGTPVSDSKTFRIKDIPRPTGTIRGEDGAVKMSKSSLEISTVGAKLFDFEFDLPIAVSGFKFKVPGQPTIKVSGSKLDGRAKSALRRAKRGMTVQVFDIKAQIKGNSSYRLKKVSPIIIELTN